MSSSESNELKLDMITRTIPSWHQSLMDAFRKPEDLAEYLEIESNSMYQMTGQNTDFPMLVPRGFARRMEKGNPCDPLLRQVLPSVEEEITSDGYCSDPLSEAKAMAAPGVLHKYRGRVLLVTTGACPIRCRYCFRRHFPYSASNTDDPALDPTLEYIRSQREITEVILSGGDPLMLSNADLERLIQKLEGVEHLQRLRIHSRMPVTLPDRIEPELVQLLTACRFKVVFVIHCNHANELDQEVQQALNTMIKAGITILNQSVLLRGVNDSSKDLHLLSERLFSCGVLPYYLHMLDQVTGATHFAVGAKEAIGIYHDIQGSLPGYLVPRLVFEKAGAESKLLLT